MKSIRVSSARASVHPEKFSESEDTKGRLSPKRRLVQFLARVVLPILTIAFTLIYLIVCIYSYNNPTLEFDQSEDDFNKILPLIHIYDSEIEDVVLCHLYKEYIAYFSHLFMNI